MKRFSLLILGLVIFSLPVLAHAAACNDGLDNDADGRTDYPNDPDCLNSTDTAELKPALAGTYNTSGTARDVFSNYLTAVPKYAYVADGLSGLQIIQVDNPAAPALVGTYNTTGDARGLFFAWNYAYVADYMDGTAIISVADPANPQYKDGYSVTMDRAYDTFLQGNYLFVVNGSNGLRILNVSNPEDVISGRWHQRS